MKLAIDGYVLITSMVVQVFAGVFPVDQSEFPALQDAITKLTLNDSSVEVNNDHSAALGQGWRLGFLGLLHMDVFEQRLQQEFLMETIVTSPNVPYKGQRNSQLCLWLPYMDQSLTHCHLLELEL